MEWTRLGDHTLVLDLMATRAGAQAVNPALVQRLSTRLFFVVNKARPGCAYRHRTQGTPDGDGDGEHGRRHQPPSRCCQGEQALCSVACPEGVRTAGACSARPARSNADCAGLMVAARLFPMLCNCCNVRVQGSAEAARGRLSARAAPQVDLIDRTEGLAHGAIRKYVAELVTSQLGDAGFQLRPEQVRGRRSHPRRLPWEASGLACCVPLSVWCCRQRR